DDETLLFYLVFTLNHRLSIVHGLRHIWPLLRRPGAATSVRSERDVPAASERWRSVRRAGESWGVLTRPIAALTDRLGFGAELLTLSRRSEAPAHPSRTFAKSPIARLTSSK